MESLFFCAVKQEYLKREKKKTKQQPSFDIQNMLRWGIWF